MTSHYEETEIFPDIETRHLLQVSKTNVDFYWFSWLDTSAITAFSLGSEFENYNAEKIAKSTGKREDSL